MKSKGMRLAVTFLALTIGRLATAAQAQQQGPQTVVKFTFKGIVVSGAESTHAYDINNKNVIVGDYTDALGQQHGMYIKGPNQWGPSCPGYKVTAFYGVNSAGTAVAYCDNGGGRVGIQGDGPQDLCGGVPCPLLYVNHVLVPDPDPPCLCPYQLLTINDIGPEVGGWLQDTQGLIHGFVSNHQTGAVQIFDLPGGFQVDPDPHPWGLNNAGMITLTGIDPASGLVHSFLFDGRSFTQIDVPGALQSFVHGINNNGDMVYTVEDANGNSFGVFFYAALRQFYWFNQPDGRHTTRAFGLNDERLTQTGLIKLKIVGDYSLPGSNQSYAYLATVTITP
jgi:hypothetical protein